VTFPRLPRPVKDSARKRMDYESPSRHGRGRTRARTRTREPNGTLEGAGLDRKRNGGGGAHRADLGPREHGLAGRGRETGEPVGRAGQVSSSCPRVNDSRTTEKSGVRQIAGPGRPSMICRPEACSRSREADLSGAPTLLEPSPTSASRSIQRGGVPWAASPAVTPEDRCPWPHAAEDCRGRGIPARRCYRLIGQGAHVELEHQRVRSGPGSRGRENPLGNQGRGCSTAVVIE